MSVAVEKKTKQTKHTHTLILIGAYTPEQSLWSSGETHIVHLTTKNHPIYTLLPSNWWERTRRWSQTQKKKTTPKRIRTLLCKIIPITMAS